MDVISVDSVYLDCISVPRLLSWCGNESERSPGRKGKAEVRAPIPSVDLMDWQTCSNDFCCRIFQFRQQMPKLLLSWCMYFPTKACRCFSSQHPFFDPQQLLLGLLDYFPVTNSRWMSCVFKNTCLVVFEQTNIGKITRKSVCWGVLGIPLLENRKVDSIYHTFVSCFLIDMKSISKLLDLLTQN